MLIRETDKFFNYIESSAFKVLPSPPIPTFYPPAGQPSTLDYFVVDPGLEILGDIDRHSAPQIQHQAISMKLKAVFESYCG